MVSDAKPSDPNLTSANVSLPLDSPSSEKPKPMRFVSVFVDPEENKLETFEARDMAFLNFPKESPSGLLDGNFESRA
jgi:hypothetical protein